MDFIAEIVLGYSDHMLSKKIETEDFTIIRYRDDYRIFVHNPEDGKKKQIHTKFSDLPNTELLDIWLQRIVIAPKNKKTYSNINFSGKLCQYVSNVDNVDNNQIWNSEWLECKKLLNVMKQTPIINKSKLHKLSTVINNNEVNLFYNY